MKKEEPGEREEPLLLISEQLSGTNWRKHLKRRRPMSERLYYLHKSCWLQISADVKEGGVFPTDQQLIFAEPLFICMQDLALKPWPSANFDFWREIEVGALYRLFSWAAVVPSIKPSSCWLRTRGSWSSQRMKWLPSSLIVPRFGIFFIANWQIKRWSKEINLVHLSKGPIHSAESLV